MKIRIKVLLLLNLFVYCLSQADGNPHRWDRRRRCDGEDYDPPCGLCEGYGGIPKSDANDDIALTRCSIVAYPKDIDNKTLSMPFFPDVFTNQGFYEVLIGIKSNAFCFGSFPGPDSTGDHCYSTQQGTFHYDWTNYRLRFDYNVKGFLYNSTLTTFHTKADMWILNDEAFIRQCICIDIGRTYNTTIYPVNPKFMKEGSRYIGREKLFIEYLWQERVVDHWVKGPHHVWVDVAHGVIIRMWQPFNGLEVFDPLKWNLSVDSSVFVNPPEECKKTGYWWRIGCDDNGNNIKK